MIIARLKRSMSLSVIRDDLVSILRTFMRYTQPAIERRMRLRLHQWKAIATSIHIAASLLVYKARTTHTRHHRGAEILASTTYTSLANDARMSWEDPNECF